MSLITTPNIANIDDVYQWLVDAYGGRTDEDNLRFDARLILTLFNHIGDEAVIREAIELAAAAAGGRESLRT